MRQHENHRRPFLRWVGQALAILTVWTVVALLSALYMHQLGYTESWRESLLSGLGGYWPAAVLTVPVYFVARRFIRAPWWHQFLIHLMILPVFLLCHTWLNIFLLDLAHETHPTFLSFLMVGLITCTIEYLAIAGYAFAIWYGNELRDRKIQESALREELAQTQLQVLRTQIRPDFLFSSLEEISRKMESDVESARTAMARLSDLLRMSLDGNTHPNSSLRQALEEFECYMDVEKSRLGSNFEFSFDAQPDALEAVVPRMLFQAAVEDGLGEAPAPLARNGFVNVRAERATSRLRMTVEMGGPGLAPVSPATTAEAPGKMRTLLSGEHALRWSKPDGQTLRIEVELPFESAEVE